MVYATRCKHDDNEKYYFFPATPENHRPNTKEGHSCCGMLKLGKMHKQSGETFVDPTEMSRQIREVPDL